MLLALLVNFLVLVLTLLGLPLRLLRSRRRTRYVLFVLRGDPPHRQSLRRQWRLFSRRDPTEVHSLAELRRQLMTLGRDPRVRGAVFKVDRLSIAPAKVDAIAQLLDGFRSRGKEVIGYAIHAANLEYEALCAADRIIFSPSGRLDLTGFSAEATALGAALDRFGISAQFMRRGEYKTAPELFTHARVSEVQRQTLEQILEHRHQALLARIARARHWTTDDARRKVDEGPYSAKRALAEGLCDALCSEDELAALLQGSGAADAKSADRPLPHFAAYRQALPLPPIPWRPLKRPPRLSLVPLRGIIAEGQGGRAPIGPEIAGSDSVSAAVKAAGRDPSSSAILLYVTSPGGSALASELVLEEVRRAAKRKPVVAYFDQVAASGGYLAAMGATEVWGAPEAIVGSIGVFAGKFDFSRLFERLGIDRAVVTRGENAGIFSPSRPFTPHERRAMEAEIEEAYQDFLEQVARARRRSKEEIHSRAEGRVYPGDQAREAGLIDATGTFEEACRRALELAKVKTEQFDVRTHPAAKRRIPMLRLMGQLQSTVVFALWLPWLVLDQGPWEWALEEEQE
jgi:protease-4